MTIERIEIVPDASQPEGGYAIVRLYGLAQLPEPLIFRIQPLDESIDPTELNGWPTGDLLPLRARLAARGVEMRIGPEIVDAPDLLPGTPITLTLPSLGISAALRWPDLPVSAQMPTNQGVIAPAAVAAAGRSAPKAAEAAIRAPTDSTKMPAANGLAALQPRPSQTPARQAAQVPERQADTASKRPVAGTAGQLSAQPTNSAQPSKVVKPEPAPQPEPSLKQAARDATKATDTEPQRQAMAGDGQGREARPAQVEALAAETASPVRLTPATGPAKLVVAKPNVPGSASTTTERGPRLWPFGLGLAGIGVMLAVLWPGLQREFANIQSGSASVASGGAAPPAATGTATATVEPNVRAILSAGDVSPRGEDATGISQADALERANRYTHGIEGPTDREEASFWLRRALSLTISDPKTTWALTQLGSLYATSKADKPADFVAARYLWRLASAAGDPVASCFLGRLHEFGLGLPMNKALARKKYEEAQRLGGCNGLRAALDRVRE